MNGHSVHSSSADTSIRAQNDLRQAQKPRVWPVRAPSACFGESVCLWRADRTGWLLPSTRVLLPETLRLPPLSDIRGTVVLLPSPTCKPIPHPQTLQSICTRWSSLPNSVESRKAGAKRAPGRSVTCSGAGRMIFPHARAMHPKTCPQTLIYAAEHNTSGSPYAYCPCPATEVPRASPFE